MLTLLLALLIQEPQIVEKRICSETRLSREIYRLIDSGKDWEALWREHAGDADAMPKVDFSQQRVLAHARLVRANCAIDHVGLRAEKDRWRIDIDIFDSQKAGGAARWQAVFAVIPQPAVRLEVWVDYHVWGAGCNGYETVAVAAPAGRFLVFNLRERAELATFRDADGRVLSRTSASAILTEPELAAPAEWGEIVWVTREGSDRIVEVRPAAGRRRIAFSLEAGRPLDDPALLAQLRSILEDPVNLARDLANLDSESPALRDEASARIRRWGLPQRDALRKNLASLGAEGRARLGPILEELDLLAPLIPRAKELTE